MWRTDDGRRGDHCPAAVGLSDCGPLESGAVLMSPALAAGLQIALVVAALALVDVPLGDYMARLLTSPKNNRVETGLYRTLRIEPSADQRWTTYLLSARVQRGVHRAAVGAAQHPVMVAVRERHAEH